MEWWRLKKMIFSLILLLLLALFFALIWKLTQHYLHRGEDLNKRGWESSYRERKLPVPESGPREGYWGARLGEKVRDERTVWREPEIHLDGLIDIDRQGRQIFRSRGEKRHRIMILGGSVAFGAIASSISTTYFNILGSELERRGLPVEIIIVAAGAWKSSQELRALESSIEELQPDLVVFLNGLNDLTNGSTSKTLYGEPTATADGSLWTVLYHAHDYNQRVTDYLHNMAEAAKITAQSRSEMLIVLQPSLNERSKRTPIEEQLLKFSLDPHSSSAALTDSYDSIRKALSGKEQTGVLHFLDCSKVLDSEKETVFDDMWHFTDFGHRIIGNTMADKIAGILRNKAMSENR